MSDFKLIQGDCIEEMAKMDAESFDFASARRPLVARSTGESGMSFQRRSDNGHEV